MFRILQIGRMPPDPWDAESEGHPYHEIIVLVRGKLKVQLAEERFVAEQGEVLLYRMGIPHYEHSESVEPCETLFTCFEADSGILSGIRTRTRDLQGRIRTLASWLYELRFAHTSVEQATAESLFHTMLAQCRYLESGPGHPLVTRIRRYITTHIDETIRLEDLARVAGISKYHFSRRYRDLCGRTPMDDVASVRLETARNMIITTKLTMAEIAERTGLGDPYHLAHVFRRKLDMSPSELRSMQQTRGEVRRNGR